MVIQLFVRFLKNLNVQQFPMSCGTDYAKTFCGSDIYRVYEGLLTSYQHCVIRRHQGFILP